MIEPRFLWLFNHSAYLDIIIYNGSDHARARNQTTALRKIFTSVITIYICKERLVVAKHRSFSLLRLCLFYIIYISFSGSC